MAITADLTGLAAEYGLEFDEATPIAEQLRMIETVRNLPIVEYPAHVIERLNKEFEIARAQIASGELKPQTAAEIAAELGITLD